MKLKTRGFSRVTLTQLLLQVKVLRAVARTVSAHLSGAIELEEDAGLAGKQELLEVELHEAMPKNSLSSFPPRGSYQLCIIIARGSAPCAILATWIDLSVYHWLALVMYQ